MPSRQACTSARPLCCVRALGRARASAAAAVCLPKAGRVEDASTGGVRPPNNATLINHRGRLRSYPQRRVRMQWQPRAVAVKATSDGGQVSEDGQAKWINYVDVDREAGDEYADYSGAPTDAVHERGDRGL